MKTMFCPFCGKKIKAGSAFCPKCGHRLPQAQAPQPSPNVVQPASNQRPKAVIHRPRRPFKHKKSAIVAGVVIVVLVVLGFVGYENNHAAFVNLSSELPENNWTMHYSLNYKQHHKNSQMKVGFAHHKWMPISYKKDGAISEGLPYSVHGHDLVLKGDNRNETWQLYKAAHGKYYFKLHQITNLPLSKRMMKIVKTHTKLTLVKD